MSKGNFTRYIILNVKVLFLVGLIVALATLHPVLRRLLHLCKLFYQDIQAKFSLAAAVPRVSEVLNGDCANIALKIDRLVAVEWTVSGQRGNGH